MSKENTTSLELALMFLLDHLEHLGEDKSEVESEKRYIIYLGKKPRNLKAPYIAINADGELSGFTEEADVMGTGTDSIGKFTMAEIEENFPQFNHPDLLVEVK